MGDDEIYNPLIRLMATITDPYEISGEPSRIDIYNKRTMDNSLKIYKGNFNRARLWVKLRQQISKLVLRETSKNSPGIELDTLIFRVVQAEKLNFEKRLKTLENDVFWPKNVIFQRFQPFSS